MAAWLGNTRKLILVAFAILSITAIGCFAAGTPNGLFAAFLLAIEVSAGANFALESEGTDSGLLVLEAIVSVIAFLIGIPCFAKNQPVGVFVAFFILAATGIFVTVIKPAAPVLPSNIVSSTPQPRPTTISRALLLLAFAILSIVGIGCFAGGEPKGVFIGFALAIAVSVATILVFANETPKSEFLVIEMVALVVTLIIGVPCLTENKPEGVFAAFFILIIISISAILYRPPSPPVIQNSTTSPTVYSQTLQTLSEISSQFSKSSPPTSPRLVSANRLVLRVSNEGYR
jgi:hypothetical protein